MPQPPDILYPPDVGTKLLALPKLHDSPSEHVILALLVPLVPCIVPLLPFLFNVIVALQLDCPACELAAVPVLAYPVVHDVQLDDPALDHLLSPHVGHVFDDLYEPAAHVFTKHVPVVIVLLLPHTGVCHVAKFVIAVQSVLHDWFPVPLFVFPASHAVHALLPVAFVYDPATHAV